MIPPERLDVYRQAMAFAKACASATARIPDVDLRRQLLRAARSIPANLAEGSASDSQAVFARHVSIALGSTRETECHLEIAREAGLLDPDTFEHLAEGVNNLRPRLIRLLLALRRNAKRRTS